jgi:hypothetical protein
MGSKLYVSDNAYSANCEVDKAIFTCLANTHKCSTSNSQIIYANELWLHIYHILKTHPTKLQNMQQLLNKHTHKVLLIMSFFASDHLNIDSKKMILSMLLNTLDISEEWYMYTTTGNWLVCAHTFAGTLIPHNLPYMTDRENAQNAQIMQILHNNWSVPEVVIPCGVRWSISIAATQATVYLTFQVRCGTSHINMYCRSSNPNNPMTLNAKTTPKEYRQMIDDFMLQKCANTSMVSHYKSTRHAYFL